MNPDAFTETKGKIVYKEYGYKYVVVLCYFFIALSSPLYPYSFSPFISKVKDLYEVDSLFMNFTSSISTAVSLLFAMFTNYLMDNHGMHISLSLTAIALVIGTSIKLLLPYSIWFIVLGNGIAGIGRNVILNGAPKTANRWFLPKNTPLVSSLIIATTPLGVFLGYLIPIMYIDEDKIPETGKD